MMSENLPDIVRSPQCEVEPDLSHYQTTYQFYREVETRVEFQVYCAWYSQTAAHHRQELEKMRGELNIFQWFRRR
jgi:hypothetical protein